MKMINGFVDCWVQQIWILMRSSCSWLRPRLHPWVGRELDAPRTRATMFCHYHPQGKAIRLDTGGRERRRGGFVSFPVKAMASSNPYVIRWLVTASSQPSQLPSPPSTTNSSLRFEITGSAVPVSSRIELVSDTRQLFIARRIGTRVSPTRPKGAAFVTWVGRQRTLSAERLPASLNGPHAGPAFILLPRWSHLPADSPRNQHSECHP